MNIKKLFNIELTSKCFDFLKKAWRFFFCSTSYKRRVFEKEPISSSCLGLVHGITGKLSSQHLAANREKFTSNKTYVRSSLVFRYLPSSGRSSAISETFVAG